MTGRTTARNNLFSHWHGGSLCVENMDMSTGGRVYVDSVHGTDSTGYGLTPDAPCATLDYADTLCTGNRYDIIYLMPGHAETISTAALSPTVARIGVKVIGLGNGDDRPTFTFTHVDANVIVAATNQWYENILFVAGIDNVVEMLDINFCDCTVLNCEFRGDVNFQPTTMIDINGGGANAADRPHIWHNKFQSMDAGAVNAIEIGQVEDGVEILDNWISGDFSDAAISSGSILTNANISRNYIRNTNAADWAIELTGAATGVCNDNRLMSDAVGTALDPGSLMCNGNLWVGAVDMAGREIPIVGGSADAVTDEPLAGHTTQNTVGGVLNEVEMSCEKISDVPNATDPLFTIAGGPVLVTYLVGVVTTSLVGALNCHLDAEVTTPAASVPLSTNVACDNDAAGTSYTLTDVALPVFTPTTAGAMVALAPQPQFLVPIGAINAHYSAAGGGGVVKWYLRYRPLSPLSVVTAAA